MRELQDLSSLAEVGIGINIALTLFRQQRDWAAGVCTTNARIGIDRLRTFMGVAAGGADTRWASGPFERLDKLHNGVPAVNDWVALAGRWLAVILAFFHFSLLTITAYNPKGEANDALTIVTALFVPGAVLLAGFAHLCAIGWVTYVLRRERKNIEKVLGSSQDLPSRLEDISIHPTPWVDDK